VPTGPGHSHAPMDSAPSPRQNDRMERLERTIQNELIPRLLTSHRVGPMSPAMMAAAARSLSDDDVASFVRAIRGADDHHALQFVREIIADGAPVEAVYLDLIAPSARRLGEMWESDDCDFVEVTVAMGRMQRLLRDLSQLFLADAGQTEPVGSVLLTCVSGEQHTLGIIMVGEFLIRDGWRVLVGTPWTDGDLLAMVGSDWYDVIGFSVGCEARLATVKREIRRLKSASRNPHVQIMAGGPVFLENPSLMEQVGAHAIASSAREAPLVARALLPEARAFAPGSQPPPSTDEHDRPGDAVRRD
jgi:MerR family transcriptional regulator, light-induced transcriptional regulator